MDDQIPFHPHVQAVLAAIRQLSPDARRRLQRRLRVSGLLVQDELLTDQNRLRVALGAEHHQAQVHFVEAQLQDRVVEFPREPQHPRLIALRMKVEQATPVRAAAQTADGVWHIGSVFLDAAGGGCSAPAMARKDADWSQTLGHAQGKLYRELDGSVRVRFRVRHPMDTGLARDNTPSFFIEKLDLRSEQGEQLATLDLREPVSEDPTLTVLVRMPLNDSVLTILGRDNQGEEYRSIIPASWRQGATSDPPARNAE